MPSDTTPFDPLEHLDSVDDYIELLNEALGTGNPSVIGGTVNAIAIRHGMSNVARDTEIGRPSPYEPISGDVKSTLDTMLKVLTDLGVGLRAERQQ